MIIQQISFASGDMFGIAAAMLFNPSVKVAVYLQKQDDDEAPGLQLKKAQGIIGFYNEVIGAPDRYMIVDTADIASPKERSKVVEEAIRTKWPEDKDFNHKEDKATELVGDWKEENRELFRQAMRIGLNAQLMFDIKAWWNGRTKMAPLAEKRAVVLWSRLSGKKGEIHLEHDTSYYGIFQLCLTALESNDQVIIAGDPPYNPLGKVNRKSRYDDIATVVNFLHAKERLMGASSLAELWTSNADLVGPPPTEGKPTFAELANRVREETASLPMKAVNLTGFWEGEDALRDRWSTSRSAQFRLYEYLQESCAEVKHLGFRSGNLEALALLGYTVRYLEERFSVGANRMSQWHGKGIGYERIIVSQVPTRSGQYLDHQRKTIIRGKGDLWRNELEKLQEQLLSGGK